MMKQFRNATANLGQDTHVRTNVNNKFTPENHQTSQLVVGEVLYPEPEPLFKQNMVTIRLARGGRITSTLFPSAVISPLGTPHGLYEGLMPGQMVSVAFENNNQSNPIIVNRYPAQGAGNTLLETGYILPAFKAGIHNFDIVLGHFSGSYLSFNTGIFPNLELPGSVTLSATTGLTLSAITTIEASALLNVNLSGLGVKMESTLGAIVNCDVTGLIQIKNLTQSMKTLVDGLFSVLSGLITVGGPTTQTISPATVALLSAEQAKWALLLKA